MDNQPENATDWTVAVLAAVGVGAAGVVAVFFTKLKHILEAVADRLIAWVGGRGSSFDGVELLTFLAEFNTILNEARKVKAVTRVVVFIGHNGGGLPTPGKPYTVRSQTGWSVHDGDAHAYNTYAFDLEVDQPYCDMLLNAHRNGMVSMVVKDMPPSLLRSIYESEGVVQSLLYALKLDTKRNKFAYLSVASKEREFTPNERAMIDVLVSRLRAEFALRS